MSASDVDSPESQAVAQMPIPVEVSAAIPVNTSANVPRPRRVECSAIPIETLTAAPTDYDPTLREEEFKSSDYYSDSDSDAADVDSNVDRACKEQARVGDSVSLSDFSYSAQQREDAHCESYLNAYGDGAVAADMGLAAEWESAIKSCADEEEDCESDQDETEQELDDAPDGFDSFAEYQLKVRPLMESSMPVDVVNIVMEYMDFDAPHRLEQVMVTVMRLLEQVLLYRKDCVDCGEQWPQLSEEAALQKAAADEVEAQLTVEESMAQKTEHEVNISADEKAEKKDEEEEEEEDEARHEEKIRLSQSQLRNHSIFYYLSPHTRKTLLHLSAKLAPYDVQLVTNNLQVQSCEHVVGKLPMQYLDKVFEALTDELEEWEDLHDELEETIYFVEEETRFSSHVVNFASYIFSLPSSGIFQSFERERPLYEVEEVSPYTTFQEGETNDEESQFENQLIAGASEVPLSSEPNRRKRARDDNETSSSLQSSSSSSSQIAASAIQSSSPRITMEDDANGCHNLDDENTDQSVTRKAYGQIVSERPQLRAPTCDTDRTAHLNKKLKIESRMEIDDDQESHEQVMDLQFSATRAVLKDPDYYFAKKAAIAQKLAERQKQGDNAMEDANDDEKEDDDEEEDLFFYAPRSSIWRRRMTPTKYEAACACVEYYLKLSALLEEIEISLLGRGERGRDVFQQVDEIRQCTEMLRISVSHYYLMHMNRSEVKDAYICMRNRFVQRKVEEASTDLVCNKQYFATLVEGMSSLAWSSEALEALQTAAEAYLTERMDLANQRTQTKIRVPANQVRKGHYERVIEQPSEATQRLRVRDFLEPQGSRNQTFLP